MWAMVIFIGGELKKCSEILPMKKSGRKKPVRFWKTRFWKHFWKLGFQKLQKAKKAVFPGKKRDFRARILAISAISLLALAMIVFNEYLFWSSIKMPGERRGYFFSEDDFNKTGENLEQAALYDIKIAVVADAHTGTEFGYANLKKFMAEIAREKPDLIINAGDLIENRVRYNRLPQKDAEKELAAALGIMAKNYPVHHVIGNHEVFSLNKNDIKIFTGENSYYSFNFKDCNFIILDSNFTLNGKDIGPENAVPGADKGFLPKEEKEWLISKLESSHQNIIFIHHPIYNIKNSAELENILKTYSRKIIMTANGHKHWPEIRKFGGTTNYDIPSLEYQEAYGIVEIYGMSEKMSFIYFE